MGRTERRAIAEETDAIVAAAGYDRGTATGGSTSRPSSARRCGTATSTSPTGSTGETWPVWLVAWLVTGQPGWLLHVFEIAAASTTVMMVFVLQHAQNRLEQATQLKLDEIIDALPDADNGLIKAEAAPEDELRKRTEHNLALRNRTPSSPL